MVSKRPKRSKLGKSLAKSLRQAIKLSEGKDIPVKRHLIHVPKPDKPTVQ